MTRQDQPPGVYQQAPSHRRQGRVLREVAVPLDAPTQLHALAAIERDLREMETRRGDAIAAARAGGASWDQIAAVLGISRQAAWERFRDVVLGQLPQPDAEDEVLANAPEFSRRERVAWEEHAQGRSVRLEDLRENGRSSSSP